MSLCPLCGARHGPTPIALPACSQRPAPFLCAAGLSTCKLCAGRRLLARFMSARMLSVCLLFPAAMAHDHDHDHDHDTVAPGASCGCVMKEPAHAFSIDCTPAGLPALMAAEKTLQSCEPTKAACAALDDVSGVQPCQTAFYLLQAHHDHCEHGSAADAHDELVHRFELACHSCSIPRAYDPSRDDQCPEIDCADDHLVLLALHTLNQAPRIVASAHTIVFSRLVLTRRLRAG